MFPVGVMSECSRSSPELPFQFRVIDLNQGRSPVRAAVGHVADEEVFEEFLQFLFVEGVVCLHCMAANGRGDHVFAESHRGHPVACGANLVDIWKCHLFPFSNLERDFRGNDAPASAMSFRLSNLSEHQAAKPL